MQRLSVVDPAACRSPLLVRPARLPGEWTRSWTYRTAMANAIEQGGSTSDEGQLQAVAKRLDPDVARRGQLAADGDSSALLCGHRLPRDELRLQSQSVQACPACLRESRSVPAIWRLQSYISCHVHLTPLVDRCVHCRRVLTLAAVLSAQCRCGRDPTCADVGPWPAATPVSWGRQLWPSGAVEIASTKPEALAAAIFRARLLTTVARSRRGRDLALMEYHPAAHAQAWLTAEGLAPAFGEEDVAVFLKALKHPVHRRAAALLLERKLQAEQANPTILSTLPLATWLQLVAPAGEITPGRGKDMSLPYAARLEGYELLIAAARRWGITPSRLRALLGPGAIPEPIRFAAGRKALIVETHRVDSVCSAVLGQASHPSDAEGPTSKWATPRAIRIQLRRSGLLGPTASCRFDRQRWSPNVGQLLPKLRARAIPIERSTGKTIALSHPALYTRVTVRGVRDLFAALESGAVPLYTSRVDADFDDLATPLDVLPQLWRQARAECLSWRRCTGQAELF